MVEAEYEDEIRRRDEIIACYKELLMGIDDDIKNFEASIDKASQQLGNGEMIYPPMVQATLSAAIMVSKAIMLLARTNRMTRRA